MKTYIVQPGHVLTKTGGEPVYAGGEIELADQEAADLAHAVTPIKDEIWLLQDRPTQAPHTKPSPERK